MGLTVARPAAAAGKDWVGEAWRLFRPAPVPWMGMTAAAFLALMLAGALPLLGALLVGLLSPFLVAGYMSASRAAQRDEPVTFLHLGAGFRDAWQPLLHTGAFYLLGSLLAEFATRQLGGDALEQLLTLVGQPADQLDPEQTRAMLDRLLPALTLGAALLTPFLMATWFAPALILFDGFSARNALWWSFWACTVNWRPMLVYVGLFMLLGIPAVLIPFGLGMLVYLPLFLIASYVAYRAMFVAVVDDLPAEAPEGDGPADPTDLP